MADPHWLVPLTSDEEAVADAADTIEHRLHPETVELLKRASWRDTELGQFEEEAVKELGRHVI